MNNYEILGVSKGASQIEIKAAYKKLVMIHHPDRGGTHEAFVKLQKAFEELGKGITGEATYQSSSQPKYSYNYNQNQVIPIASVYKGIMLEHGAFKITFAIQNISRIVGCSGGLIGMSWTTRSVGRGLVTLYFTKNELESCNYYLELAFESPNGSWRVKEVRIKKPPKPLSTWQKVIKTIKKIF